MSVTPEDLLAYADGELDGAEHARVETAIAANPAAREVVERHRALRARLAGAFAPALDEPVPQQLIDAANAEPKSSSVVDFAMARAKKLGWSAREWGAMAACLLVGLTFGAGALRRPDGAIVASNGVLVAHGALERALDSQLASDRGEGVHIGLTFRDADGDACRTFVTGAGALNGLACREGEAWQVETTVAGVRVAPSEFRTAAVETPASILAAVEAKIAGEAFDAQAEKAARDRGWR